MKSNAQTKLKSEKKKENNGGGGHTASRPSIVSRSRSRLSSASIYNVGQSLTWRSDGKSGFKMPKYQNNYRLEPYLPFKNEVSDVILARVMTKKLTDLSYDSAICMDLCRDITQEIRDKLYKTDYDRIKYAVSMTIIENAEQSFVMVNGRSWDSKRDNYSTFVYESPKLYAVGIVMAMYYE